MATSFFLKILASIDISGIAMPAPPKGTPALRKPTVMGRVEQAQNGVSAPNPAAITFPKKPAFSFFLADFFLRNIHQYDFNKCSDYDEQYNKLNRDVTEIPKCVE